MGAFGFNVFENDDALDWVDEYKSAGGVGMIEDALNIALSEGYLEIPEASTGLAAAEFLAILNMSPSEDSDWSVIQVAQSKKVLLTADLLGKAQAAVKRIRANSELADEWGFADPEGGDWSKSLDDLLKRLEA
jgi:hypothetical protein